MSPPSTLYHYFRAPLQYQRALRLQENIHELQARRRLSSPHPDVLLLLQHPPVYTAGRRQNPAQISAHRARLAHLGVDLVQTQRGGELTFHGPGQLVAYPLLDLARARTTVRAYACLLQTTLKLHLAEAHGLQAVPCPHPGVFLDAATRVATVGVQVRHGLTLHGVALNVTRAPLPWFEEIAAGGLEGVGVSAGAVEVVTGRAAGVEAEVPGLVARFGRVFETEMRALDERWHPELFDMIASADSEELQ
ncbi:lipoyltransferase [Auriscalpium vulgare]|uniref:Lipoyltransferase n=1 Tax=Auriscalpium vulgare TaxID=40419 RepID=A0ACB8REQ0_9AGAM|nr:lipoyltransferase [Auriscalpium vulgare]